LAAESSLEGQHLENLAWLAEVAGDFSSAGQLAARSAEAYIRSDRKVSALNPLAMLAKASLKCGALAECQWSLQKAL
jgi:hypothetical protein